MNVFWIKIAAKECIEILMNLQVIVKRKKYLK